MSVFAAAAARRQPYVIYQAEAERPSVQIHDQGMGIYRILRDDGPGTRRLTEGKVPGALTAFSNPKDI